MGSRELSWVGRVEGGEGFELGPAGDERAFTWRSRRAAVIDRRDLRVDD